MNTFTMIYFFAIYPSAVFHDEWIIFDLRLFQRVTSMKKTHQSMMKQKDEMIRILKQNSDKKSNTIKSQEYLQRKLDAL